MKRANAYHKSHKDGCIFVSLHSDAAGNSGWYPTQGMSVFVAKTSSQNSKTLARCIYTEAEEHGIKVRKYKGDTIPYYSENFYVIKNTACPAILVEMFFHTNNEQVNWALTEEGKQQLTASITDGIDRFIN